MSSRNRRKRQRRRWLLIELACAAAFVVLTGMLVVRITRKSRRSGEERAARETMAQIQITMPPAPTNVPLTTEPPNMMFDYAEELLKINSELVGMVGFDDMALYVCQGENNTYYASHRFDGSEDPAGMIYMDWRCSSWPLGQNTILYGHNMRDGSRFGKLNRLTRAGYLAENPYVRYATLYEIRDYRPIAVFYANVDPAAEDYFDFAVTDIPDEASFNAYVQEAKRRSVVDLSATAKYGDNLLTLATCSEEGEGGRLVVVCVPIE